MRKVQRKYTETVAGTKRRTRREREAMAGSLVAESLGDGGGSVVLRGEQLGGRGGEEVGDVSCCLKV